MRVLLVEDDAILGVAVRDQIAADGHTVDWVRRLDEAGDSVRAVAYELILLDLMLPDGRGLDSCAPAGRRGRDAGHHPDGSRPDLGPDCGAQHRR